MCMLMCCARVPTRWYNDYVMRFGHVGADHLRRVAFLLLGLLLTTHLLGCLLARLDGFGD